LETPEPGEGRDKEKRRDKRTIKDKGVKIKFYGIQKANPTSSPWIPGNAHGG